MSVSTEILCILLDADRGIDDAILLATAMQRGDDARIIYDLVGNLQATDASCEAIAVAICAVADSIISRGKRTGPPLPSNSNAPSGPKERWGYECPITPRLPEKDWWALRWTILERDEHTCRYCATKADRMCADHVVPLSRGGTNDPENLVACCLSCNSSKSDRLLDEWQGRRTA